MTPASANAYPFLVAWSALIAVLDIQITNSSLPEIEGGIGTGSDNGTWISTAYLIWEIIMIPLTDYFSRVFTVRRFLLTSVRRDDPHGVRASLRRCRSASSRSGLPRLR